MFKELKTLYILFLSYRYYLLFLKNSDYSICCVTAYRIVQLCSYSICSVYTNNKNIQNAININVTYVWKFWKVEYTRQQAITICMKTVRETQALNILLLPFETRSLPQNQRSFTTYSWSFSVYTIYRCINIHVNRNKENSHKCYHFSWYKLRGTQSCSPYSLRSFGHQM